MSEEVKRFEVGDEVTAYYKPIALIEGKIYATPPVDYEYDKYFIKTEEGGKYMQRGRNIKRRDCDHELLYSSKRDLHYCPFCDDI